MIKSRDSFIFYRSFFESTLPLDKEQKAELFDAVCNYALDGKLIELNGIAKGFFTLIKPQLDANRKKWVNGCKEKSKKEVDDEQTVSKSEAKEKQTVSKSEGNVNENVECKSKLESKSKLIDLPNSISIELWNNFVKMRKEIKKPITESIAEACIEKLIKFESKKIGNANLSLQNSIAGGYQGLFEPKQDFSKNDARRDVFQQFLSQDNE